MLVSKRIFNIEKTEGFTTKFLSTLFKEFCVFYVFESIFGTVLSDNILRLVEPWNILERIVISVSLK